MPLLPVVIQTLPSYTPVFSAIRVTPATVTLTSAITSTALVATPTDQRGANFSLSASTTGPQLSMPASGWLVSQYNNTNIALLTGQFAFQCRIGLATVMQALSVNGNSWGIFEIDSDGLGTGTNAKIKLTADMTSSTSFHLNMRINFISTFTVAKTTASIPSGQVSIYGWFDNLGTLTQGITIFDSNGNVFTSGQAATTANMPTTGLPGYTVVNQHTGVTGSQSACVWDGLRIYSPPLPASAQFTPPWFTGQPGGSGILGYAGWPMNDNSGNTCVANVGPVSGASGNLILGSGTMGWTTGGQWSGTFGTPLLYGSSNQAVATVNSSGVITRVAVGNCTVNVWCGDVVTAIPVSVTS